LWETLSEEVNEVLLEGLSSQPEKERAPTQAMWIMRHKVPTQELPDCVLHPDLRQQGTFKAHAR
jgi:hypothetical protein